VTDDRSGLDWEVPTNATRDTEHPNMFSFVNKTEAYPYVGGVDTVDKHPNPVEYTLVARLSKRRITVALGRNRETMMDTPFEPKQPERFATKSDWFDNEITTGCVDGDEGA